MFVALVVAAISLSVSTSPSILTGVGDTTSFKVDSTEFADFTFPTTVTITDSANNQAQLSLSTTSDLTGENSVTFNVALSSMESDFSFAKRSTNVVIGASNLGGTQTIEVPIEVERDYCSNGKIGDLKVDVKQFDNNGRGKDDEWYLLDNLDIEVRVDNDGNEDVDEVIVAWAVINKNTGKIIVDDEENDFNLNDGDDKTITFNLDLDPDDFDSSDVGSELLLLVKAYSDDVGENVQCDSTSESAELFGDDFLLVDVANIDLPETLQCGTNVEVNAKVWNIGSDSQDDVEVKVLSTDLKIDQSIIVGDVDELSDESFSFQLQVPTNAKEGTHTIRFEVYDEDGDLFEDEDDDESIFSKTVNVQCGGSSGSGNGGTGAGQASVGIVAKLDSNAIAGQELVVRTTITNTGDATTSYNILATGYDDWAGLNSIEPRTFTLASGESRDVKFTLMPKADTEGTQDFTVQVVYSGVITEQKIEVPIQVASGSGITGGAIGSALSGNWFIWLIVLINVVLVILIIVVAVRMANR